MTQDGTTADDERSGLKNLREWITVLAAIVAAVFAWTQFSDERDARRVGDQKAALEERRSQAEQVSAWIVSDEEGGLRVRFSNASGQPIYQAIVTPVVEYGAGPNSGRDVPDTEKKLLAVIPPGTYETFLSGSFHGMHTSPGMEIAFTDRAGRSWVRSGSGELSAMRSRPVAYYHLDEPVKWELPDPASS